MVVLGVACPWPTVHIPGIPLDSEVTWVVVCSVSILFDDLPWQLWSRSFWDGGAGFVHCSIWQRGKKHFSIVSFLKNAFLFCFMCGGNCAFVQLDNSWFGWGVRSGWYYVTMHNVVTSNIIFIVWQCSMNLSWLSCQTNVMTFHTIYVLLGILYACSPHYKGIIRCHHKSSPGRSS